MIFELKLPEPGPRRRWSAQELAAELGLEVTDVMTALKAVGEYVDNHRRKMIEEPVVKKVFEHFGRQYKAESPKPVSQWQVRDLRGAPRPARKRKKPQSRPVNGPRRFESSDRSLGLGHPTADTKDAWADSEWQLLGFTEVERDVWLDGGLRRGRARDAKVLRDAGFQPADLRRDVFGWSVAKRLRAGEHPEAVLRLLRRAEDHRETGA